ncbi:MAG: undecaprenyl/decaprenyl-phosphate alpha-N-acetylglucosaminyl 1-phosphate transferase [Gemmatimonadetes bacterium]|nr:undecaprenyl/decaprenyl-phosphate alpha-N-acetylglucosaminyl 1-phosphate transferase [Gemmatimonadota bacterium]
MTLLATFRSLGPVMIGAAVILLLGVIDDVRPFRASLKLLAQIVVALGMFAMGVRIELLSFPLGSLQLAPVVGVAFTVLWFVGITNAFNLLDGADGVATGSAFFSATAVFIMSVALGHPGIGLVAAALAGSLLGFLPFNFPPARAFLGDSGSMLAGFLLAGLAVEGSTKSPTLVAIAVPLVAFAVPVFDTTITIVRRLVRGQPIFQRDQGHVHHRLQQFGYSPRQVAALMYGASAVFALLAMFFINPSARSFAVVLIIVGAAMLVVVRFLKLHEINELARLARRGVLQPRSIVMNVQLRRAAERLETAHTLTDLHSALAILFGRSEFDEVVLKVAPLHERRGASVTWHLVDGAFREGDVERQHDEWEVVCPFDGKGWVGALHLRRRLGRRSLMMDLNLLMEIVQPALENVAARIENPLPQTS